MKITAFEALAGLEAIVEEFGADTTYGDRMREIGAVDDYAQFGCAYTVYEQPACLVGVYFDRKGIHVPSDQNYNSVDELPEEVIGGFTPEAIRVLVVAQAVQDNDGTWGDAVEGAKSVL